MLDLVVDQENVTDSPEVRHQKITARYREQKASCSRSS